MNIRESEALANWIDSKLRVLQFPGDRRVRITVSFMDIVHSHHRSIIILLKEKLYVSAFALGRSTYEAFVRGVWLDECATEEQIEKFINKDCFPGSFEKILSSIEQNNETMGGLLKVIKETDWRAFNSFTHTGFLAIERQNTQSHIEPNYDKDVIERMTYIVDMIALFAGSVVSQLAGNIDSLNEFERRQQQRVSRRTGLK